MTIVVNQRTYVGISSLLMKRKSDDVVLTWPVPDTFVLNTGIEQRIQMTRNKQGRKTRAGNYVVGEMPELTVSYSYIQPELISFCYGNQFAAGTFATQIPRLLEVTATDVAGDPVGGLLNGLVADAPGAAASVTRAGLSTALTIQPFASFDGTIADSFAVGADGALKFSDNLVANKDVVAVVLPHSVAGIKLSDVLVGPHELYATLIDNRNTVSIFEAKNVTPNIESKTLDFSGEAMELQLFLNNVPGECRPWDLISSEISIQCV